jgi:hypothetical protein
MTTGWVWLLINAGQRLSFPSLPGTQHRSISGELDKSCVTLRHLHVDYYLIIPPASHIWLMRASEAKIASGICNDRCQRPGQLMPSGNVATMLKVDADLNHGATKQEGLRCTKRSDLALSRSPVVHAHLPPFTVRSGFPISLNSAADKVTKEDNDGIVSTSRKRRI